MLDDMAKERNATETGRAGLPKAPMKRVVYVGGPKGEESIRRLLAAGKLSQQTRKNYVLRIRAYLRRIEMSPDQFVRRVFEKPEENDEDLVKFIAEVS